MANYQQYFNNQNYKIINYAIFIIILQMIIPLLSLVLEKPTIKIKKIQNNLK